MFLRANLIILKHWVSRCWHSGHRIQPSIVEVVGSNSAFITGQKKRRNKRPKFFSWMIANSRLMILQAFDCKLFFFFEKRTIYGLFFFLCIVSIGTKNQNVQYYNWRWLDSIPCPLSTLQQLYYPPPFQQQYYRKNWTRIVKVKGEHTDHLTTTNNAHMFGYFSEEK